MDMPKNINTRYILFTRFGEKNGEHCGNGQDKHKRADSNTCGDKGETGNEGWNESDVYNGGKHGDDKEAGRHKLGGTDEAAKGRSDEGRLQANRGLRHNRPNEKREKTKVVTDTNVLISATFWKGLSESIVWMAQEGEVVIIISSEILREYLNALDYKELTKKVQAKGLTKLFTAAKLAQIAIIVEPKTRVNAVRDDPDDNKIIEAAIEGKADFILTYDKHLLKLKEYESVKIVTPEEFINVLLHNCVQN